MTLTGDDLTNLYYPAPLDHFEISLSTRSLDLGFPLLAFQDAAPMSAPADDMVVERPIAQAGFENLIAAQGGRTVPTLQLL